jgi:imidazole glycerol-phosphate synthase subunit HisH
MQVTHFPASSRLVADIPHRADIVVIDYELGNLRSVVNALEAVGANVKVSRNKNDLTMADGLVLPGVGSFGDGMANLRGFGLIPVLEELVLRQKKPFLGICVGMQLLSQKSYEGGEWAGLGWLDAQVVRFDAESSGLKVPHVGWNDVISTQDNELLGKAGDRQTYYFVHSYYLQCAELQAVMGHCSYGVEFPAAIQKENIWAVQFHPEKSQKHGLKLLGNFLTMVKQRSVQSAKEEAC